MKEIPLRGKHGKNRVALVSDDKYAFVVQWKWFARKSRNTFYATRTQMFPGGSQKSIQMHREILGVTDSKKIVDHEDHNGLNNQDENIRVVTTKENVWNSNMPKNNTTGFIGVYLSYSKKNPYCAIIGMDWGQLFLGNYSGKIAAALAYNNAALEIRGSYAVLNELSPSLIATISESDVKRINYKKPKDQIKKYGDMMSRFKGVSWNKGKWTAEISKDGVRYRMGRFESEEDAARQYNKKCLELYGSQAKLNIITEPQAV